MASEVRCNGCRHWFSAGLWDCPRCGKERAGWNRALHVAMLNGHLYKQAEASEKEEKAYRRSLAEEHRMFKRYGLEPPGTPTREEIKRDLAVAASSS